MLKIKRESTNKKHNIIMYSVMYEERSCSFQHDLLWHNYKTFYSLHCIVLFASDSVIICGTGNLAPIAIYI